MNFDPDRMNTPGRRAAIERAKGRAKREPRIVVVDTEGSGLFPDDGARVSVISWAYRDHDAVSGTNEIVSGALPFGQGPEGQLLDQPEDVGEERWNELLNWLSTCELVFHNAAHDLHELRAGAIPGYAGRSLIDAFVWDTMVAQRNLDPLEKAGLEPVCVRRLHVEPWKAQIDRWKKTAKDPCFHLIPWSVIEPYATDDAIHTLELYEDQQRRYAAGEGDPEVLTREHNITRVLYRMEVRGVGFDGDGCADAARTLQAQVVAAEKALPLELRPPTPARICANYYDRLGYLPTKLDKGELVRSADELSRKGLRDQGAPWIDELDTWSTLETALTSWYVPWSRSTAADGRLRMRVRQTKVSSGRFSGERVNLLAIPHDEKIPPGIPTIRSFIRPAAGKRLFEVDLSQAEVRVGAVAVRCEPMKRAFAEGLDAYAVTALDVFGVDRDHEEFSHYRGLCKRIVLSTMYAGGMTTLIRTVKQFMGLDLSEEDATRFLGSFRGTYPEFKRAEQRCKAFAEKHGYIGLALNERRYFKPYEASYKALNQRIQGSVAVVMKPCMIEVEDTFPGALLLQTHDSLLLETADETIAPRVARIMERTFTDVFGLPFTADIKEWN